MENNINKQLKRNLLYAGLALLIVAAYIAIDGLSMIMVSARSIGAKNVSGAEITGINLSSTLNNRAIVGNIIELYISRMIYLVLTCFPIVFFTLRFHISFKKQDCSGLKSLVPYLRAIFGLIVFYYILTIKTQFSHELFTNFYSFGHWMSFFRIVGAFAVFGGFVIDWPTAFASLKKYPSSHAVIFKAIFVLFISVCSCMLLEFQVGSKMNMQSNMLFFNVLYWTILQVLVILFTRSVKAGAFVSIVTAYLIGIVNDVVNQFRGNYVMFGDLTVVRTALEVAGNYTYKPDKWFWLSLVLLVLLAVLIVLTKFPKNRKIDFKEIAIRAGAIIALSAAVFITYRNGKLYHNIFGVGWDYNMNVAQVGYIPYFLSNMNAIEKVTLDGYDAASADEALSKEAETTTKKISSPNIIIVQNEAFADLSVLYDIKTNKDYMPFIHSMTENTRKGYLNMSVTGGPTANTEFEILMRSTLNFLPYGSVPYTQYVHSDLPSVAQALKTQPVPYHTVSYHSYYSSGYRRTSVYGHFGFDESYFEDNFKADYPANDIPRGYLSDSANFRRVESLYEDFRKTSDAPWFCFNVTVQNHGGYTQKYNPPEEDKIYVTNFEAPESFNGYLSLIKKSDDAFRELVEYFKNCDEPTIIAMYGDHQPTLEKEALTVLEKHTIGNNLNNYYVPYVIWANFDIEEADTLGIMEQGRILNTLSTNYFASTVFEIAGIRLSDYDRYLLDLHKSIPAITAIGVWDSEGKYYSSIESSPHADELKRFKLIQYNLIFDDKNRLIKHFVCS